MILYYFYYIYSKLLGIFTGDEKSQQNGKSGWREKGRPQDWPFQSSSLTSQVRQLSRDIIVDEWKNISAEAMRPFMYTLPLDKYVIAKRGQPVRAMVGTNIFMVGEMYQIKHQYVMFITILYLYCFLGSNHLAKRLNFSWRSIDDTPSNVLSL